MLLTPFIVKLQISSFQIPFQSFPSIDLVTGRLPICILVTLYDLFEALFRGLTVLTFHSLAFLTICNFSTTRFEIDRDCSIMGGACTFSAQLYVEGFDVSLGCDLDELSRKSYGVSSS